MAEQQLATLVRGYERQLMDVEAEPLLTQAGRATTTDSVWEWSMHVLATGATLLQQLALDELRDNRNAIKLAIMGMFDLRVPDFPAKQLVRAFVDSAIDNIFNSLLMVSSGEGASAIIDTYATNKDAIDAVWVEMHESATLSEAVKQWKDQN